MSEATTAGSHFGIGTRKVGRGAPVFLVAEIGSNHDGSLERAKQMITLCADAGADAVKFQSFTADGLYVRRRRNAGEWQEHPVWKALRGLELPMEWIEPLSARAREVGVVFMSTPFESRAVTELEKAGALAYKIASGDLTHLALIREVARTGKPLLIATGMADLTETRSAVEVVLSEGNSHVGLFHCVSLYPPRYEEMNLRAIATLEREFGCPVGLSDHTPGHDMVLGAVALGATLVEKHVTLDRGLPGPDHPYAMLVDEFAAMVKAVRNLEAALGNGEKAPVDKEAPERINARRGLFAAKPIRNGGTISAEMIRVLRPALGLAADRLADVIGAVARRDIAEDEPIGSEDVEIWAVRMGR